MFRALALLLALSATACATSVERPSAKEEAAVWLSESPRSISVEVDPQLPSVTLRTRDHHVGQRIGSGVGHAAIGGVYTVAGGCMAGGPIGCVVGVILAPVGMVVGGVVGVVRVNSTDSVQGADNAGEGPAKMKVEQALDLPSLLGDLVVAQGDQAGRHSLHARPAGPGEEQATLRLRFTEIELFGDTGEDPSLSFTLRVAAEMQVPGATAGDWGCYEYSGSSHWVSTWLKNDGELLRKELRAGASAIARQAARALGATSALNSPMSKFWRVGNGTSVGC
jgi:hypothetical protein